MATDSREYPESIKYNTLDREYFCLDIETTSLTPENEGILEVYWMHMKDGLKVKEGHQLFWHDNHHITSHIHQIPIEDLEEKPSFESEDPLSKEFVNEIAHYLERCCDREDPISLMAQYVPFEIKWMSEKLKMNLTEMGLKVYDTRSAERFLYPSVESASLIPMCDRRGIISPNGIDFHRAQWDVEAMWKVAEQQFVELEEKYNLSTGMKWKALK